MMNVDRQRGTGVSIKHALGYLARDESGFGKMNQNCFENEDRISGSLQAVLDPFCIHRSSSLSREFTNSMSTSNFIPCDGSLPFR